MDLARTFVIDTSLIKQAWLNRESRTLQLPIPQGVKVLRFGSELCRNIDSSIFLNWEHQFEPYWFQIRI